MSNDVGIVLSNTIEEKISIIIRAVSQNVLFVVGRQLNTHQKCVKNAI
jgi:hypothetical protein